MEINDKTINEYFWDTNGNRINRKFKSIPHEILEYLDNRYSDSESYRETIIRIYTGYEERPTCPICGNKIPYIGYSLKRGVFGKTCSVSCGTKYAAEKYKESHGISRFMKGVETRKRKRDEQGIPYQNVEKWKSTMREKYGTESLWKIPGMKDKIKETCLEKYGTEYYLQSEDCKEKTIEKFGVDNYRKTEESKRKTSEMMKGNKEIQNKREKTMLSKYGATTPFHTEEYYQTHDLKEIAHKGHLTKLRLGSYKQSRQENHSYELLKEKFPNVIRQYKEERYPFNCDFYIPELDLFIECQYHWTHNGHPYDENNEYDVEDAKYLIESGHEGAWHTWTIRDVKKRNTAKENNLNWIEFFTTEELVEWIEKYPS